MKFYAVIIQSHARDSNAQDEVTLLPCNTLENAKGCCQGDFDELAKLGTHTQPELVWTNGVANIENTSFKHTATWAAEVLTDEVEVYYTIEEWEAK